MAMKIFWKIKLNLCFLIRWLSGLTRQKYFQVYYQGWNRSPAQVGCMRQMLRAGALGRPRGMGWRGRQEGESGWGTHVNPWLTHVNVWQKPVQYCKIISLQLIKINEKRKKKRKKESTLQFEGHSFDPWSWKIPHTSEKLSSCTTAAEPMS